MANELRIANRLSLQNVAYRVGISKAHLWNLENGLSENPSMELVLKLAELFRVRVAIYAGENPDSPREDTAMVAMFRAAGRLLRAVSSA